MRDSLARVIRTDPSPAELSARTAHVMEMRRRLLPAGLALVDLTAVKCPERRRMIETEARAQIGGTR